MNKPEPTRELVIEPSEQCDRCLMLYAVSAPARAFIKTDCASFGILKPVDLNPERPPQVLSIILGRPAESPPTPAPESIVYSLHVWPNYDLQQVRTWLESWPHVGVLFEQAINEVIDGHH